jgi:hypothetical protein
MYTFMSVLEQLSYAFFIAAGAFEEYRVEI